VGGVLAVVCSPSFSLSFCGGVGWGARAVGAGVGGVVWGGAGGGLGGLGLVGVLCFWGGVGWV